MMRTLSVVIPAFNEEASIGHLLDRLATAREDLVGGHLVDDVEIMVVDDGSTDQTASLVAAHREVVLVRLPENRGYGAALKFGFLHARGDYIAFLDADGTYPPEALPQLVEPLVRGSADIAVGSRLMGAPCAMPRIRYLGNRFFAALLGWLAGRKITDPASGMRVLRKDLLPALSPLPDGLDLTPAMSTRALHEQLRTLEVPIPYAERRGRSKLSIVRDGIRFFATIYAIARLHNPLQSFGAVGMVLLMLALLLAIDPVAHYLRTRRVEDGEIYRLFTIMVSVILGINLISFGAFSNQALSILHPRHVLRQTLWNRILIQPRAIRWSGWVGLALILTAVLLNHRTIVEYILTRRIQAHWTYVLTGALLLLTGAQLVMGRALLKILEELRERQQASLPALGQQGQGISP